MEQIKLLERCLSHEHLHQDQIKNTIIEIVEDLSDDAINGRIPKNLINEKNLDTIQEIFFLSVKDHYESGNIKKTRFLLSYFYDAVREEEIRDTRAAKESVNVESAESKQNIGTQYPENYELTFDDKEGTTSTKENDAPLRVNRKHLQRVRKRDNKSEKNDTKKKLCLRKKHISRV